MGRANQEYSGGLLLLFEQVGVGPTGSRATVSEACMGGDDGLDHADILNGNFGGG